MEKLKDLHRRRPQNSPGWHPSILRRQRHGNRGRSGLGSQVLEAIRQLPVDVLVLDIDMGQPNGIEIAEIVSTQHPGIRILILSMLALHDFVIQAPGKGRHGLPAEEFGKG
ncbi:MAG: response regulator [Bacteroidales bacterium]